MVNREEAFIIKETELEHRLAHRHLAARNMWYLFTPSEVREMGLPQTYYVPLPMDGQVKSISCNVGLEIPSQKAKLIAFELRPIAFEGQQMYAYWYAGVKLK